MRKKWFSLTVFLLPFLIGCSFDYTFTPPKYNGSSSNSSSSVENIESSTSQISLITSEISSNSEVASSSELPISSTISSNSSTISSIKSSSSSEYKFDFNYEWPEQYEGENPVSIPLSVEKDFRIRFEGARSFEDSFDCKTLVFDKTSSKYYAKTYKTLYRNQPYTYFEDVAMYYMAFNTWPENYKTNKSQAVDYGVEGRCISTYTYGQYSGSNNYTNAFGEWNNMTDGIYYELDIDVTSDNSYNNGSSIPSRGTGRLVVIKDGLHEDGYGAEPVIFYTTNHYSSFNEFYNYYGGWGEEFLGAKHTNTRPNPKTISNWVNL